MNSILTTCLELKKMMQLVHGPAALGRIAKESVWLDAIFFNHEEQYYSMVCISTILYMDICS